MALGRREYLRITGTPGAGKVPVWNATLGVFEYKVPTASDATFVVGDQAAVASVASPDATDLATALTLVNELKAQVNALLVRLRTAGVIAT